MPFGLVGFDKRELGNAVCLIGIDEAGRGCLAGPVVASAIRCEKEFYHTSWCARNSRGVDDSKRLKPSQRAAIVERYKYAVSQNWIRIGIGTASIDEIEKFNIYHANSLAMRRALEQVVRLDEGFFREGNEKEVVQASVLIDGKPIRTFPVEHKAVVKGDQKSLAVALAGIHAKEYRDGIMAKLDQEYPAYKFCQHKGYGTAVHLEALRERGPCPQHRPSFMGKVLVHTKESINHRQDSLF